MVHSAMVNRRKVKRGSGGQRRNRHESAGRQVIEYAANVVASRTSSGEGEIIIDDGDVTGQHPTHPHLRRSSRIPVQEPPQ